MKVFSPAHSLMRLPAESGIRRLPRAPNRRRSAQFNSGFEDRIIFYDCFWHESGDKIVLVGPPPLNLEAHQLAAKFTALPGGEALAVKRHQWRSTLVTELAKVPGGTTDVRIQFAGFDTTLAIQPNHSDTLAGHRVMFTMNKDNDLDWIAEWVRYHALIHGVDAIVLFDNGSTHYSCDDLAATLAAVPGLRQAHICDWPYRFGALDRRVIMHRFWAHFLQNAAMTSVIRRFGATAQGLLNCDIDELVAPVAGGTIFDLVNNSPDGLVMLDGIWVSSSRLPGTGDGTSHFDFEHVLREAMRLPSPGKWVLDAKRAWVQNLNVMASWHRLRNVPSLIEKNAPHARFWHFQGINSNWKSRRRREVLPHPVLHRRDAQLAQTRIEYRNLSKGAQGPTT